MVVAQVLASLRLILCKIEFLFHSGSLENHVCYLSVLKRCVPKTLAFAFGLRLRSKTRCFKTRGFLALKLPMFELFTGATVTAFRGLAW